jgi:hypothetical protein
VLAVLAVVAAVTMLAGPTAYAATTIANPPTGSIVSAGPSTGGAGGGGGVAPGGAGGGSPFAGVAGTSSSTTRTVPSSRSGAIAEPGAAPTGATRSTVGATARLGAVGGVGGGTSAADPALDKYLVAHKGSARYIVAVSGSQTAATIILATGEGVMAMGGFTGSDPAPTLTQFKAMVASGEVHYLLVGGGDGGGGGASTVSAIDRWVEAHGTKVSSSAIGGTSSGTLYYVSSSAAG